jgi:hypothetical protein
VSELYTRTVHVLKKGELVPEEQEMIVVAPGRAVNVEAALDLGLVTEGKIERLRKRPEPEGPVKLRSRLASKQKHTAP